MRTIVHLSDLHFGANDASLLEPLLDTIAGLSPHVIAVSGDLTQRARIVEFQQARAFLDRLPAPTLVVPGNHDVPLFNIATRLVDPLGRYRRFIDAERMPIFEDAEVLLLGLNSARAIAGQGGGGRLSRAQVIRAADRLAAAEQKTKFVVTHHPFDIPASHPEHLLIGRADMAIAELTRAGADVLLAGHLHVSHVGETATRYHVNGHSALVVQAGTLSARGRGEPTAFNVLRVDAASLTIERRSWTDVDQSFSVSWVGTYERTDVGWRPS